MKKLLFLISVVLLIFLGYLFALPRQTSRELEIKSPEPEKEILRVALVADSHNENDLLAKALAEAKNRNADFVIGLGDYTNLGAVDELIAAKKVFDESGLEYYLVPGDRDGWESRQRGLGNVANFLQVFNLVSATKIEKRSGIQFVLLNNSDIYKGISSEDWESLEKTTNVAKESRLTFVFAHKTPFHPDSSHVMGEDSPEVAGKAQDLLRLLEEKKVNGFFSGDLHFFAQFNSPGQSVKITTIGAVASERNFQGPRFSVLKVFDDYSWEVEDVEIK
ncbi:metallophosphoesterase [Candidatus Curtissbacteria bacterium]|nr:metallophosphoesterase [Candidatus Curtissbacteria bacterium]